MTDIGDELQNIIGEFLVESREHLDRLDGDLVALEASPNDERLLASIFRGVHTIKGSCGWLGFARLEALTHAGEGLLARLRDASLKLTREITSTMLTMFDAVRRALHVIETTGAEGEEDFAPLIAKLQALARGETLAAGDQTTGESGASNGEADSTVRVKVGLLDTLVNLVGELVLARNQIIQGVSGLENNALSAASQRLSLITSELQEGIMQTRMQPIANVWNRLPRLVREVSLACGKQVRVHMEGGDTELDRTLIEAIKDPLTHIVRNSVDHGIEGPEERQAAGKNAEGNVFLRAYHEGGHINIELRDDGGGVNLERVRQVGVQRGLISAERAEAMSESEAIQLIFVPGFSTASAVTNVSGRGVGMDVVKSNIERIGGTIDIQTRRGLGTTIKLKIPLTLAIIPALLVACSGERYAIPQGNLLELVRLESELPDGHIETIYGAPVYRLRGNLLPLVYLDEVLTGAGGPRRHTGVTNIIVLEAGERRFGLVVDGVHDTEEIVVKPLSKHFKEIRCFAGATILGDGKIALVLDVDGLAIQAQVVSDAVHRAVEATSAAAATTSAATQASEADSQTFLLVGAGNRLAVPLEAVARLEEIDKKSIERVGNQEVLQYRGIILPLVRLNQVLEERRKVARNDQPGVPAATDEEALKVVVCAEGERSVGVIVDSIIDIVEEAAVVTHRATRRGVRGSAVLQGLITELVDMEAVMNVAEGDTQAAAQHGDASGREHG